MVIHEGVVARTYCSFPVVHRAHENERIRYVRMLRLVYPFEIDCQCGVQ